MIWQLALAIIPLGISLGVLIFCLFLLRQSRRYLGEGQEAYRSAAALLDPAGAAPGPPGPTQH